MGYLGTSQIRQFKAQLATFLRIKVMVGRGNFRDI